MGPPLWTFNCNHLLALQETRTLCSLCRAPIPPSNFGQAIGPAGRFPNPNIGVWGRRALNSSNCVNFLEELSHKDLFVFDKTLNSNESDDYEALEPSVLGYEFIDSVHDQPKAPLVESLENVSDIDVKNSLTSYAQFWQDIGASPWVMSVIEQGYSLPFTEDPPPAFFTNNQSAFKYIKLLFLMKSRDCWRQAVFVKLRVMKHI